MCSLTISVWLLVGLSGASLGLSGLANLGVCGVAGIVFCGATVGLARQKGPATKCWRTMSAWELAGLFGTGGASFVLNVAVRLEDAPRDFGRLISCRTMSAWLLVGLSAPVEGLGESAGLIALVLLLRSSMLRLGLEVKPCLV